METVGSVAVWGEAATGPSPSRPVAGAGQPLELACLRGETTALQLGVRSPSGGPVALSADFSGPAKLPPIASFFEERASDDELEPLDRGLLELKAGAVAALWVEIHVPLEAPPGSYRGVLRVGADSVEVDLLVSAERLPALPTLRVTAAVGALGPNPAAAVPLGLSRGVAPEFLWQLVSGGSGFDGKRFDSTLLPMLRGRGAPALSAFVLPELPDLDDVQRFQLLLDLRKHLGSLDGRVVQYGSGDYTKEEGADRAATLHRALPKAQLLLATEADGSGAGDGVIVPIGAPAEVLSLDEPWKARPHQPLWWQLSFEPQRRFPSLAPGGDRAAVRAVGWMAFVLGVRGVRLLAPAAGAALVAGDPPRPTVRLELLRAAIQDHALLSLALARDRQQTLAIARRVAPRADAWPVDAGAFERARLSLLALLATRRPQPSSAASGGTRRSPRSAGRARAAPGRPPGASAATPPPSGSAPRTGSAGASAR